MVENNNESTVLSTDYRASHLARGAVYDETLGASFFDHYMALFEDAYLKEVVPSLFAHPPTYIDFACGTGRITRCVSAMSSRATGIDVSPSMLEQARVKCPGVNFVEADITKEEFRCEPVDLVTSFRFLGNAGDELRRAAMKAINRLLKVNGYLIINSHRNPLSVASILARAAGAPREMDLTYFKLKRLLQEFGFRIVMRRPIGFWIYRARLMTSGHPTDQRYRFREERFGASFLTPFAPDAVLVATKIKDV